MPSIEINGYHGTVWERPLIPNDIGFRQNAIFHQLATAASDLESVFFSDHEPVAEFFSELRQSDEENELRAVLRGRVCLDNVHQVRVGASGQAKFEDQTYQIPEERLAFYQHVRESGFDGVMMLDDYQSRLGSGHDIALFSDSVFTVEAVRLFIGDRWTPWLDQEKAVSLFKRWSDGGLSCHGDSEHRMALAG